MFTGIYEHTVDKKGRASLPARFRGQLSDCAYISMGIDQNLVIYSVEKFEQMASEISDYNLADPIARKYRRRMFNKAEQIQFDANGRFLIPSFLREALSLNDSDKIIFAGSNDYIEIWTVEDWKKAADEAFYDVEITNQYATLIGQGK